MRTLNAFAVALASFLAASAAHAGLRVNTVPLDWQPLLTVVTEEKKPDTWLLVADTKLVEEQPQIERLYVLAPRRDRDGTEWYERLHVLTFSGLERGQVLARRSGWNVLTISSVWATPLGGRVRLTVLADATNLIRDKYATVEFNVFFVDGRVRALRGKKSFNVLSIKPHAFGISKIRFCNWDCEGGRLAPDAEF